MSHFLIRGGSPLKGSVTISGAKNAAIKMIAASLLTVEEIRLLKVPRIGDVDVDLEIVRLLGVETEWKGEQLRLRAGDKGSTDIPRHLGSRTRSAVITVGPLLARFGKATLPAPGGCRIGNCPIDRHLAAFECLGAEIEYQGDTVVVRADRLVGAPIRFEKNTVMGTESVILASVLASGETVITGAAQEPEVDDLIELLLKMGAEIERSSNDPGRVVIRGVEKLSGATHEVLPDRNEVVTFAIAAALTCGDVVIKNVRPQDLTSFLSKFESWGGSYEVLKDALRVWVEPNASFSVVQIETAPHPGFMTDWQQPFSVLLTQAEGESLVHETIYPQRFGYLSELEKMGARVRLFTPSEVGIPFEPEKYGFDWSGSEEPRVVAKVFGSTALYGANVVVTDLRAGATLVLAALAAEGESKITGIEHIDRGYENFEEKLQELGADIERVV